jgi:hypothetical protein
MLSFIFCRQSFDRLKPLIDPEGDFKIIYAAEDILQKQQASREYQIRQNNAELACESEHRLCILSFTCM